MTTLTFVLYLVFVGLMSWWAYQRTKRSEDYFLGGRQLSASTTALSAGASDMSGWLLLGLPGYAFSSGLESLWLSLGLCLGLTLCWLSMAKRLRIYTEYLDNALTIPCYLQRRFNDSTFTLRLVTAFFILLFFLFYVSSGFVAGGKLFSVVFDAHYITGVYITFFFVVIYTFVGGFLAVSWTDVLQGLLMLLALLIAPIMVVVASGGYEQTITQVALHNDHLLNPITNNNGETLGLISILNLLAWGLGYFGQPHILARFKAIRSSKDVSKATSIAIAWSVLVNIGAIAAGLFAIVVFSDSNIDITDKEHVFIVLTNTLFHPVIAGVLMAAVLAAIMSTADSQLLVCSSAFAEDIINVLRKNTPQDSLKYGRIGVLIIGILAAFFAMDPDSQVLDVVSYAWAGLGAAFGPVILVSLYSSLMSRKAAISGIVVGGVTVLIWKNLSGGWFDLYELLPGFIFSLVAIGVVRFVEKVPSEDLAKRHNEISERFLG